MDRPGSIKAVCQQRVEEVARGTDTQPFGSSTLDRAMYPLARQKVAAHVRANGKRCMRYADTGDLYRRA